MTETVREYVQQIDQAEDVDPLETDPDSSTVDAVAQQASEGSDEPRWLEMLKSESPAEDYTSERYMTHALNFNNSEWMAQFIRGAEGMFDGLNYAVLDMTIGLFRGLWNLASKQLDSGDDSTDQGGQQTQQHDRGKVPPPDFPGAPDG